MSSGEASSLRQPDCAVSMPLCSIVGTDVGAAIAELNAFV